MKGKKIILALIVGAILSLGFLVFSYLSTREKPESIAGLETKTGEIGGITFQATPLDFNVTEPVKFEIKIDTHSGSLDFDLVKISILEDNKGNKYLPSEWQGMGPGGHHRSGILIFPKINNKAGKISLIINADTQRIFEWNL